MRRWSQEGLKNLSEAGFDVDAIRNHEERLDKILEVSGARFLEYQLTQAGVNIADYCDAVEKLMGVSEIEELVLTKIEPLKHTFIAVDPIKYGYTKALPNLNFNGVYDPKYSVAEIFELVKEKSGLPFTNPSVMPYESNPDHGWDACDLPHGDRLLLTLSQRYKTREVRSMGRMVRI